MKNKVLSIIGIVWGSLIILNGLLSEPSQSTGAAKAGESVALVLGFAMLGFSIYNYRKQPKDET